MSTAQAPLPGKAQAIPTISTTPQYTVSNDDTKVENLKAIVIDNGTHNIHAGFSGDNKPNTNLQTVITQLTNKQLSQMYSGYARQSKFTQPIADDILSVIDKFTPTISFIGGPTTSKRINSYPIQKGIINNWDDIVL